MGVEVKPELLHPGQTADSYVYTWTSFRTGTVITHGPTGELRDTLSEGADNVRFGPGETWQVLVSARDSGGGVVGEATGYFRVNEDGDAATFTGWIMN